MARLALKKADWVPLCLAMALLFVLGALSIYKHNRIGIGAGRVYAAQSRFRETERLLTLMLDAETGERGYLLTNSPKYLEQYESAVHQVPSVLADLRRADPKQTAGIERTTTLKLRELAQGIDVYRNQGRDAALAAVTGVGDSLMGDLRREGNALKDTYFATAVQEARNIEVFDSRYLVFATAGRVIIVLVVLLAAARLNQSFGIQSRLVKELTNSQGAFRLLVARLHSAREEERAGLAREIHDELGQTLTGIKIDMAGVNQRIQNSDAESALTKLNKVSAEVDGTIRSMRRIATGLRPAELDHLGLAAAVETHAREFQERSGIETRVRAPFKRAPLDLDERLALFRIVQESLTNVARHARASLVTIDLEMSSVLLTLTIKDNGVGFKRSPEAEHSLGLLGMQERARLIGAELSIDAAPGAGTAVTARLPLNAEKGRIPA